MVDCEKISAKIKQKTKKNMQNLPVGEQLHVAFVNHVNLGAGPLLASGPKGPGSLTLVLVTRRGCSPQTINPISPTPKSILGITQIITKPIKSLCSIKIYLSAQFQCLTLFT